MGVTDPKVKVDHEDHNGLNCQRENLRVCTNAQNVANQRKQKRGKSSQFKGVYCKKRDGKWYAQIEANGEHKFLGSFADELDAAFAYDVAARQNFGEFALCNFR